MDSLEPRKKPLRPPPKLRTKTGCLKCRERRKKCDERRPVCEACERLHIQCVYQKSSRSASTARAASTARSGAALGCASPESIVSAAESVYTASPLDTALVPHPGGLRTDRDWRIFQYCSTRYIRLLTSPDATSEFRDMSFVFAIGFDEPWVMHAALAPAALHASCAALVPKEDAIIYTHSALQGLRQAIQKPDNRPAAKREAFLAASLFLGVFEDFYSSAASQSLTHYRAIAQVLEEQAAERSQLEISQLSVFQRTILDSVLYHFATRLIFEQDIDPICRSFPAHTMARYIDAPGVRRTLSPQRPSILPVLGVTPPALFLQIYQITWLSRQLPFDYDDAHYGLALQCLAELDVLEEAWSALSYPNSDDAGVQPANNSRIAAKLYFLATRVFLVKVLDPEHVWSASPQIESLLFDAHEQLRLFDGTAPCSQFICWPMLVIGCAACATSSDESLITSPGPGTASQNIRREVRVLIRDRLVQIWSVSYSGYVRRTASALEKIWSLPSLLARLTTTGRGADEPVQYDGLQALLSPTGVGTALLAVHPD